MAGNLPGIVAVRDSKDPTGPALVVASAQWMAFVAYARHEERAAGTSA